MISNSVELDVRQEAAICTSTDCSRIAEFEGTFKNPHNKEKATRVGYCVRCACLLMHLSNGMFVPDDEDRAVRLTDAFFRRQLSHG